MNAHRLVCVEIFKVAEVERLKRLSRLSISARDKPQAPLCYLSYSFAKPSLALDQQKCYRFIKLTFEI